MKSTKSTQATPSTRTSISAPPAIYWGNVVPLFVDKSTSIPLLTVTSRFYVPLIFNFLFVLGVCFGMPYTISAAFFHKERSECLVNAHSGSIPNTKYLTYNDNG